MPTLPNLPARSPVAPRLAAPAAALLLVAGAGLALGGLSRPASAGKPNPAASGGAPMVAPIGAAPHVPGPSPLDRVRAEPAPAALRAAEIDAWVDAAIERAAQDDPWAVIDQCMRDDMAASPDTTDDDTSAASIAVAVNGVLTFTRGYGVRDQEAGGEVDPNTLFRIGSTTKMMTAAAVMQLVEDEALDLDAPLGTYVPEYRLGHPWDADELTLHRMLSHQTAMIDQYFVSDLATPLMTWVQTTGAYSLPLYAPPGTFWNYANPGFSMAGAVVERVGGMPFGDYVAERVWEPAGMPRTTLSASEVISDGNFATGYRAGQPLDPRAYDYPFLGPAGTAFSTPTEMVTWALLMQAGDDDVLSAASKALMQARHVNQGYLPWMDYGYGIFVTDWRDAGDPEQRVVVYDHGGNIHGGSSQLFWVPERGVVVSILANTIRSLDNAAACAVRTLAGIEMIPSESELEPPETWDDHVGTYSFMDLLLWPWTASVTRTGETLTMDYTDVPGGALTFGERIPLYYAFGDVFVAQPASLIVPSVDLTFIREDSGEGRVRYLRNRNAVGQRVGQFPARVELVGEDCAPVRFRSELDMPVLQTHARGLFTPTVLAGVPLAPDDPADPSSSAIKHDLAIREGGASAVYVTADTEADDAVGIYLLRDANGDGQFALEDGELVAEAIGGYGLSLLHATEPVPAGAYQLWVHGALVGGDASALDLEIRVLDGTGLRLENVPRGLADGAAWEMRACAEDTRGLSEPLQGMIEFAYDSPPRRFRIMVDWRPGEAPEGGTAFLPVAQLRHDGAQAP